MTTIKEIAKLAHVSKSTVSNAFNNPDALSKETRQRILEISQEHNYRPEYFMNRQDDVETNIIEFNILRNNADSFFTLEIFKGILQSAAQENVQIVIKMRDQAMSRHQSHSTDKVSSQIILDPNIKDVYARNRVTVLIGNPQKRFANVSTINNNNLELIADATEVLLSFDHEHILFLNTGKTQTVAHERLAGFKATLYKNGILFSSTNHYMVPGQVDQEEYVYQLLLNKSFLLDNISAIICDSTEMAQGVYRALEELQLQIPEDISVLALCHNSDLTVFNPALSYFDLQPIEIGRYAFYQALQQGKQKQAHHIKVDHHFVSQRSITYAKYQS